MSITCLPAKLVFFPIPKVACTSIKVMLYEINNHVEWRSVRIGFGQVHGYPGYRSLPFNTVGLEDLDDFAKIAVVRNPIDRAISAYRDKARKLVLEGTAFQKKLEEAGLPLEPDPDLFFSEIDQYFDCASVIKEHMRPFSYHLGLDLGYFDQIFKLEEMDELSAYVSDRLGKPAGVQASNSSKRSINTPKEISPKTMDKIVEFCEEDLNYLSDYYTI